jgi:hypothetical protein
LIRTILSRSSPFQFRFIYELAEADIANQVAEKIELMLHPLLVQNEE